MTEVPRLPAPTQLLDLLPDAVCVVDPAGTVLYLSAAFERILGYSRAEVIGRAAFTLVHPDDRQSTQEQANRVMQGNVQRHFRNRYMHKQGHTVDLLWSAEWLPEYGVRLGVAREISELRRVEEELQQRAQQDPLTGVFNRRGLQDAFARMRADAVRAGAPLSVLYLDLDAFKRINDRLGHEMGDHALEEVARRLQGALRQGDVVARIGGDEFVVLLPGCGSDAASTVCHTLMARLHAPFALAGQPLRLDASVGIASFPSNGDDLVALLAHADAAMYEVKRKRQGVAPT